MTQQTANATTPARGRPPLSFPVDDRKRAVAPDGAVVALALDYEVELLEKDLELEAALANPEGWADWAAS